MIENQANTIKIDQKLGMGQKQNHMSQKGIPIAARHDIEDMLNKNSEK